MKKMRFEVGWINLMMECVSYVTYSMLVNGEPGKTIKPSRGLDKGTLYPLIFSSYMQRV